ncbi:hypothetical protein [Corynebacterium uterequi]|nr:hypothetical protein [Corynebacterium uterequi]
MSSRSIVPVSLSLNQGDVYTLWAPTWVEHGSQWQAFLGDDTHILGFSSPAELLCYIESTSAHDLASHPQWATFNALPAHRVVPGVKDRYDLVGVPDALAGRASYDNVATAAGVFEVTESLAHVGQAQRAVTFFATHSVLRNVQRGAEHYGGSDGDAEWTAVGRAVLSNWAEVLASIDEVVRVVEPSHSPEQLADAEARIDQAQAAAEAAREKAEQERQAKLDEADPYDTSVWAEAGIDPIKITARGTSVYSLRTYVDGRPVFLGRYGQITTFPSRKHLVRWIIEHDDHDLARVSTWEDVHALATGGDLEVTVHPDNAYSFTGLAEDILEGPDAVDAEQMNRAYELMADAADWAADDSLNSYLLANPRFQDYLSYMLGSTDAAGYRPSKPYQDKADSWREIEDMLIKRLSKF